MFFTAEHLLEQAYGFYQRQLARSEEGRAYLAGRGIHDREVIERMRIGYAPGACLRGYLTRLGYSRYALLERGLVDLAGRDCFFRCLTFPLEQCGSLYGRSLGHGLCRHRFLPGSKGRLYGWSQALAFPRVIVVEGLFDVAALWQAGFPNAVAALGLHLKQGHDHALGYFHFDVRRHRDPAAAIADLRAAEPGSLYAVRPMRHLLMKVETKQPPQHGGTESGL